MKNIYYITLVTLLSTFINYNTSAQSLDWVWATSFSDSGNGNIKSIASDHLGYTYITGTFDSTFISFNTNTVFNTGGIDMFVAKIDGNGNPIWIKNVTGITNEDVKSIAIDNNSNIIITGAFSSPSINIDSITLTKTLGSSSNIFIIKFNSNGNVLWAKNTGGSSGGTFGNSITNDINGNIYITGGFSCPNLNFDSITLTNNSFADIFIVKFDSNGNVIWAQNTVGGGSATEIIYDSLNNVIYLTGKFFTSDIIFDTITLTNNPGESGLFLLKYSTNGNAIWAKAGTSTSSKTLASITIDHFGSIYISGNFHNSPITFDNITLVSSGNFDGYIIKYDSNGNTIWGNKIGSSGFELVNSIKIDSKNNLIIVGEFWSSTISIGTFLLTNNDISETTGDIFIAKLNNTGNTIWAKAINGNSYDNLPYLTIDNNEDVLISFSSLSSVLYFDGITVSNSENTNTYSDVFLAKLDVATGIKLINKPNNIAIYPNPTSNSFTVSGKYKSATVTLYNIAGQIMVTKKVNNGISISVTNLPKGIYVAKIVTENNASFFNKVAVE